uniref:Uncharacterized protein B24G20.130 n=1 Tax=Neurospora crassa TaxID=5141 RepID=Q872H6_NEUCS|nr:hypothetical protein [Neurospora crassa]
MRDFNPIRPELEKRLRPVRTEVKAPKFAWRSRRGVRKRYGTYNYLYGPLGPISPHWAYTRVEEPYLWLGPEVV